MWIGDAAYRQPDKLPLFYQRLREMGINTAMVHGDGNLKPLLENQFPYYVENMVNRGLCLKFSSKVTDWDKFVTGWTKNGRPESALVRDYCFDDPQWRAWARKEMQSLVRKNMGHAPVAYNIRDELSTTISANPFDYDFNPLALAGFRKWLQTQYTNLTALNAEWETKFASWEEVKPFTTDQIKNRMASGDALPRGNPDWQAVQRIKFDPISAPKNPTRWNFAPWCDFRSYMDLSLANMLGDLRQAAHALDPRTPVGVEGTQMPSAWGGYDLWRLSQALDWVEPYDIGNSREILGSFMPGKPLMTTVFEKDTSHANRRLWHLLLEGDRGCIIWWSEDCIDWKSADYALTKKAKALAPVMKEMQSPLAELFIRAERERDRVFILYSHPSIQVDWLLESTVDGSTWLRRFSSFEAEHNVMAKKRNGWVKLMQDLGYSPQFVAADQLAGAVDLKKATALVLSDSYALSDSQIEAVIDMHAIAFAADAPKHTLFSDGPAGQFDEHGRLRPSNTTPAAAFGDAEERLKRESNNSAKTELAKLSSFAGLTAASRSPGPYHFTMVGYSEEQAARYHRRHYGIVSLETNSHDIVAFSRARHKGGAGEWYAWAQRNVGISRSVTVPPETCTRIHRFRVGDARLLAFERNIDYHISEDLKQAGGNEDLEKAVNITATLDAQRHVYDLRSGKYLGHIDRLSFLLDPWQPSLFALLEQPVDEPVLPYLLQKLPKSQ